MSTRAIYSFIDATDTYHVYVHYDGYPSGAAAYFKQWLDSDLSWTLPRFEADEAAAGFIASIKTRQGNVRIAKNRTDAVDVEYGYRIYQDNDNRLCVQCVTTNYWGVLHEEVIFDGAMDTFIVTSGQIEESHNV
jgi:hypothetical protein